MTHNWWWVINDESPDDPCIWSRGNLYPFFWCKWYLVSSFQICVGGLLDDVIMTSSRPQNQSRLSRDFSGACFESHSESNKLLQNNDRNITSVFRITWHCVTWWWRHRRCFRHVIMGSHDIPIYSILKCSNRTKFTCNFSLYMWGVASKIATVFFLKCCILICNPLDYFCASEFRSKAIWPTADNRLKNSRAPLVVETTYAPHPIKSIRIT